MDEKIIEHLKDGQDFSAREKMSDDIGYILHKSAKGEIAIAEYIVEIEKIIQQGKEYEKIFRKAVNY